MLNRILHVTLPLTLILSLESAGQITNEGVISRLAVDARDDTLKDSTGTWKVIRHTILHPFFLQTHNSLMGYLTGARNTLERWSLHDGQSEDLPNWKQEGTPRLIAVGLDEERLAIISYSHTEEKYGMKCYSSNEKKWTWEIDLPKDHYFALWFIQNGNQIAAAGSRYLYLINSDNGIVVKKEKSIISDYKYNNLRMMYLNVSCTGRYIVIWNRHQESGDAWLPWFDRSAKKTVTVWDVVDDKPMVIFEKPGGELNAAAFTDDEKYIILSSSDNIIRLWSIEENRLVKEVACNTGYYMISSKKFIVLGNVLGSYAVTLLRYPDLVPVSEIDGVEVFSYNPPGLEITISREGDRLAFQKGCKLYLYETETWKELWNVWVCTEKASGN